MLNWPGIFRLAPVAQEALQGPSAQPRAALSLGVNGTLPVQPPSPFPSHTDPLVPGWQVIYFQTHTDTSLFLRQRGREGFSLRYWALIMVWLLPTAPGPPVSITCSEALALLCSLHSGTSLSSPLADIFIQSVRLPPTHTPTQHSYGKNTARL